MYKIGIDVGGTFTKAVAIHSESMELAGKATVPTTYDPKYSVLKGIIASLQRLLEDAFISPQEVELLSFSTTHAVNALLEGDVSPVGIIALGTASEKHEIIKRTRLDIELSHGKKLSTFYEFIDITHGLDEALVKKIITKMKESGAEAIVVSEAFGVDDPENEDRVKEIAEVLKIPCVAGHEISGAYGLEIRTITATINASILPRMIEVAEKIEKSVRELGIKAPIMVMKCDGGLSTLEILKTKPIFTILSGPAASVVGTHLYSQLLDGIIIEVGGTTTNISVVKNGRAEMRYIDVLGYPTTIRSVDVRILPVGGGDMIRVKGRKIVEVGPRSARIAGLPYSTYESPDKLKDARVANITPKEGDPEDYVALETPHGKYAITLTCASNYLGIPPNGDYAEGKQESAEIAIGALSESLCMQERRVAGEILKKASRKLEDMIKTLMKEYKLDHGRTLLVGVGGGAGAIIPYTAKRMGLAFHIPEHAEVISSAGTAMAMLREELERNMDEYDEGRVETLVEQAREAVIRKGAMPETVSVSTEYISERRCIRVVAVGSTAENNRSRLLDEEEAKKIACSILRARIEELRLAARTKYYLVFERSVKKFLFRKNYVLVLDKLGRVHTFLEDGVVIDDTANNIMKHVKLYLSSRKGVVDITPSVYVVSDSKVMDYSVFTKPSKMISALSELLKKIGDSKVVVVVGR